MDHLKLIDYFIILVVLGITLWLGFRFSKKQNTTENYFLSKGNFPAWALGLSLLSTLISSVTGYHLVYCTTVPESDRAEYL